MGQSAEDSVTASAGCGAGQGRASTWGGGGSSADVQGLEWMQGRKREASGPYLEFRGRGHKV